MVRDVCGCIGNNKFLRLDGISSDLPLTTIVFGLTREVLPAGKCCAVVTLEAKNAFAFAKGD